MGAQSSSDLTTPQEKRQRNAANQRGDDDKQQKLQQNAENSKKIGHHSTPGAGLPFRLAWRNVATIRSPGLPDKRVNAVGRPENFRSRVDQT